MYKLIVADYAQIEPRLLSWYAGDLALLGFIAEGMDIYEAHARATMGYSDTQNLKAYDKAHKTNIRFRAKRRVLSYGYGCGWKKAMTKSEEEAEKFPKMRAQIILTEPEARQEIAQYRADNPKIVNFWKSQQNWLEYSVNHQDPTHEVGLASGRSLTYFNPRREASELSFTGFELVADETQGVPKSAKRLYGGKITENIMQATAWDITGDAWLAIEKTGHLRVLWTIYDELVVLAPEKGIKDHQKEVEYLMCNSSPWAKGLPIAASSFVTDYYMKED